MSNEIKTSDIIYKEYEDCLFHEYLVEYDQRWLMFSKSARLMCSVSGDPEEPGASYYVLNGAWTGHRWGDWLHIEGGRADKRMVNDWRKVYLKDMSPEYMDSWYIRNHKKLDKETFLAHHERSKRWDSDIPF